MNVPPAPSPWIALRRTRRPLIAVTVLLGLWLALALFLMYGLVGESLRSDSRVAWLALIPLGFVVSHAIVGWKLIRLIKVAGQTDLETSPQTAAHAFTSFWRTNLKAHALLWAWFLLLFILAAMLLLR